MEKTKTIMKKSKAKSSDVELPHSVPFNLVLTKNQKALLDNVVMAPNFSEVSRRTGVPVSTLWDAWKKLNKEYDVNMVLKVTPKGQK
jgi:hypothetical protein